MARVIGQLECFDQNDTDSYLIQIKMTKTDLRIANESLQVKTAEVAVTDAFQPVV